MNKNSNIHIVGLSGAEGTALVHYFVNKKFTNITVHDFCDEKDFAKNFHKFHTELDPKRKVDLLLKTKNLPVKFKFGKDYLEDISNADILFVPQSWFLYPESKSKILKAVKNGVKIKSMMQLYLELAKCVTIGITGSNGKTTTSNLVYNILKKHKENTYLVGNDRKNIQILDKIESLPINNFLVLEISNRQLKMPIEKSPHISVVTNITQNHLHEHSSFDDYKNTKLSLLSKQNSKDFAILNQKLSQEQINSSSSKLYFSLTNQKSDIYTKNNIILYKNKPFIDTSKLLISGTHNYENIMAAILVCKSLNIPDRTIQKAIYEFKSLPKRLEPISRINDIDFINDLSSTTPESTINAMNSFKSKDLTLIIGGEDKGLNYDEFIQQAPALCNRILYSQGSVADKVIPFIKNNIETLKFESIEECIKTSYLNTKKEGVVLFSPMGEGFISKILHNKKLSSLVEKIKI